MHKRVKSADNSTLSTATYANFKKQNSAPPKRDFPLSKKYSVDGILDAQLKNSPADPATPENNSDSERKSRKKEQKLHYEEKKKQANVELRQIFLNPDTTIARGWLILRNSIKSWVKFYCLLKPGLFMLFTSDRIQKPHNWCGTVMLHSCQILERPSKKDGFCFKLFHPLGLNFWAKKGPRGQTIYNIKSVGLPLTYLIARASDDSAGRGWVDALNCAILNEDFTWNHRSHASSRSSKMASPSATAKLAIKPKRNSSDHASNPVITISEYESSSPDESVVGSRSSTASNTTALRVKRSSDNSDLSETVSTKADSQVTEYIMESTAVSFSTEVPDYTDGKNRFQLDQNVVEFESFLKTLVQFYASIDILESVPTEKKPQKRLNDVITFCFSGVNHLIGRSELPCEPVLGEIYRCYWQHNDSKTFCVAECVSKQPLIICVYLRNRKAGFAVTSVTNLLKNSKEEDLSVQINQSTAVTFIERSEVYNIEFGLNYLPLDNSLSKANLKVTCLKSSYSAEINFEPGEQNTDPKNATQAKVLVSGQVFCGGNDCFSIKGCLNGKVFYFEPKSIEDKDTALYDSENSRRLPSFVPDLSHLLPNETSSIWAEVNQSTLRPNDEGVWKKKVTVEDQIHKKWSSGSDSLFHAKLFAKVASRDGFSYQYKYVDERPWDPNVDVTECELNGGEIRSITKIKMRSLPQRRKAFERVVSSNGQMSSETSQSDTFSSENNSMIEIAVHKENSEKLSESANFATALAELEASAKELRSEISKLQLVVRAEKSPSILRVLDRKYFVSLVLFVVLITASLVAAATIK